MPLTRGFFTGIHKLNKGSFQEKLRGRSGSGQRKNCAADHPEGLHTGKKDPDTHGFKEGKGSLGRKRESPMLKERAHP